MTDDYDNTELVSAYLDNEVTADERARVESDPSLLAEVERLRRVQAAIAEAEAPPMEAKEAAIAAALAAFDDLHAERGDAAAAGPSPGQVVPLSRRRRVRWMQGLSAAAAVAVIVVGGIVVANRDDDGLDTATEPRETAVATTAAAAVSPTTTQLAAGTLPTASTAAERDDAATDATLQELGAAPEDTTSMFSAEDAAGDAESQAAEAPAPEGSQPSATSPPEPAIAPAGAQLDVLRTDDDLTAFAEELDAPPPSVADVVEACEDDTAIAEVIVEDADGVELEAAVARSGDGYAAVSLTDCEIVLDTTD